MLFPDAENTVVLGRFGTDVHSVMSTVQDVTVESLNISRKQFLWLRLVSLNGGTLVRDVQFLYVELNVASNACFVAKVGAVVIPEPVNIPAYDQVVIYVDGNSAGGVVIVVQPLKSQPYSPLLTFVAGRTRFAALLTLALSNRLWKVSPEDGVKSEPSFFKRYWMLPDTSMSGSVPVVWKVYLAFTLVLNVEFVDVALSWM